VNLLREYFIEDIAGFRTSKGIVCTNCLPDKLWETIEEKDIITHADVKNSEEPFFCDYGNHPIPGVRCEVYDT
jgi:hypothetical protein